MRGATIILTTFTLSVSVGCFAEFPDGPANGPIPLPGSTDGAIPQRADIRPDARRLDVRILDARQRELEDTQPAPDAFKPDGLLRDAQVALDVAHPADGPTLDVFEPDDAQPVEPGREELVINEFDYDQPMEDDAEFIELLNRGPRDIDLEGYTLELVNGTSPDDPYIIPLVGRLRSTQYFVLGNQRHIVGGPVVQRFPEENAARLQNAHEGIRLIGPTGNRVDSVSYGGRVENSAEGEWDEADAIRDDASAGEVGLSRCPNGEDTDNNVLDFRLVPTSPGKRNACP